VPQDPNGFSDHLSSLDRSTQLLLLACCVHHNGPER